ncbi:RidA family protein [Granulicella mallensis]|uniref:Endoribonuclease L-PSP n=1 Tax=Granulicella mallensis (strain ATCC BAA-1857 / DSM 23137 / MP5ACTX8) TaxID=682795 RepID=G8NSL0_GRAMM|nr:RidA family protein [Granulicella mallensis]AEU38586.1 Endoribonuclease L-PSP [Granulicella mallensis MP5ACTX8]
MKDSSLTLRDCDDLHDPTAQGYSHLAIVAKGASVVYISGQYASGTTAAVVSPLFEIQISQAFQNLRTAIHAAGATPHNVAKLTVFIVDHSEAKLPLLGMELSKLFGIHRPALTLIPVPRLAMDSILFEVETVLVLD